MKQYNRIMLGEHGKYITDCLAGGFIGAAFLKNTDFSVCSHSVEKQWRQKVTEDYLHTNPDKSVQAAQTAAGFLWTICYGLKKGDIVLAPNDNGGTFSNGQSKNESYRKRMSRGYRTHVGDIRQTTYNN